MVDEVDLEVKLTDCIDSCSFVNRVVLVEELDCADSREISLV